MSSFPGLGGFGGISAITEVPIPPPTVPPLGLGDYGGQTEYHTDMGLIGLPVAGPVGTPSAVAQIHSPMAYKVINWTANAVGGVAALPDADTGSPNDILLYSIVRPAMPQQGAGAPNWVISGTYIYLQLQPPSDNDALEAGITPYGDMTPDETVLQPEYFSSTIFQVPSQYDVTDTFAGSYPFNSGGPVQKLIAALGG